MIQKREVTARAGMKQVAFRLIPEDLDKLKVYCYNNDTNVQEMLETYVKSIIEEDE